jgi:hypothetical protein
MDSFHSLFHRFLLEKGKGEKLCVLDRSPPSRAISSSY